MRLLPFAGTSVLIIYLCNRRLHAQIFLLLHDKAKLRGFFSQKFRLLLLKLSPDDNRIYETDNNKTDDNDDNKKAKMYLFF